jgi:putative nucleotidyltransferase with HDIG domain
MFSKPNKPLTTGVPSVDSLLAPGGQVEPPPSESLAHKLIERFQSSAYQPPLMADVAAQVVELSRRPFKPTEALRLLERDAFFAGRVMQVAQSPVHNGGAPVTSLAEAVTRLGHATLGPIFLAASTKMRVFRNRAYLKPMEQLQAHSLAVAHLAKLVSRHTSLDPQVAFTCGLLHDVGTIAAMMIYGDTEGTAPVPEWKEVWPSIRPVHERATQWLCGRWRLPPVLAEAVANHHGVRPATTASSLAAVVALADGLAPAIGFSALDEGDAQQVPSALAALGLSPAQHQALLADASGIQAHVICR